MDKNLRDKSNLVQVYQDFLNFKSLFLQPVPKLKTNARTYFIRCRIRNNA